MTNEEITQTIQHEIQKAQQPLLDRIADLEQELDEAMDYINTLNTLSACCHDERTLAVKCNGGSDIAADV